LGPLPSPLPSSPLPSSPSSSPFPSFPLPLEVDPILRLWVWGELNLPSWSGRRPAAKQFLVHFKHYFHREQIEKQIRNSKIEHCVLHNKFRANLRREKTKFIAKNTCTDDWGPGPLGSLPTPLSPVYQGRPPTTSLHHVIDDTQLTQSSTHTMLKTDLPAEHVTLRPSRLRTDDYDDDDDVGL